MAIRMGLLFLLAFGFGYDRFVGRQIAAGMGDFTARFVVGGVLTTMAVLLLDSGGRVYPGPTWVALAMAHFAASGLGMAIGSWRRMQVTA